MTRRLRFSSILPIFTPALMLVLLLPPPSSKAGELTLSPEAGAGAASEDKKGFSILRPAPAGRLRELSADRPDTTESPITVDGGRFQIESSFFDFGRQRLPEGRVDTYTWGSLNLKVGLLPDTDLQFVIDPWVEEKWTGADGRRATHSGIGDPEIRLKMNFFGNDGETPSGLAAAVMPFVRIPSGSDVSGGEWEGGIILPLSVDLSERVSLGLMLEMDLVHATEGGGYEQEWVHTAVMGFELTKQLGLYVEYVGTAGTETGFDYQAACSGGLTWAASENVQWDIGGRIGLNAAAEEFGLFTGITRRF